MNKKKRRFGDRYDGRILKNVDPFFKIIPYIMKSRVDAQVYFDDKIILTKTEKFLLEKREEKINIGFLHIVCAAMVRTISQKPKLNRFVSGRKMFARNGIYISLAVKKDMTEDSPETTVKVKFKPTDTIFDVVEKVNRVINESQGQKTSNETDKTAKMISMCPRFVISILVKFLTWLDKHGKMPKVINEVSPFHTSLFITDMGSLGIRPVYHHIYDFGTTSIFIAFGIKNKEKVFDRNNNIIERKFIDMKIVVDERICDGFYYAKALRIFKRYMENPHLLEKAPDKVVEDNEI
ncbi:2-oxo acid dehydrogenase subunit E2 [Mycoplasmatota bacterium]|nr:2-oxo acid dehydrogenase subunit E2 [Mycoplasmatota bacterium]